MFEEFGINAGYVEDLHATWQRTPQAVSADWQALFEGSGAQPAPTNGTSSNGLHANGASAAAKSIPAPAPSASAPSSQRVPAGGWGTQRAELLEEASVRARVFELVNAYRVHGHLYAKVDPLGEPRLESSELSLATFGLERDDLDRHFPTAGVGGLGERAKLRDLVAHLRETYCGSIGVEFMNVESRDEREWLQNRMETTENHCELNANETLRIVRRLTDAESFEQFLHRNFVGAKRFSAEGAESMIAMLDLLIESAGKAGVDEIVLGMAHRGRLNVLVNIMGKNPRELFAAFDDKHPDRFLGTGDVKYHLGYSKDWQTQSGKSVHLTLTFNPSHLEFVNPVVEGRVRAKRDRKKGRTIVPLLIHGDGAFIGQGVNSETFNLAQLEGYETGGTLHLVVNNQVGFTTKPEDARSTRYCTDIARMVNVPVFHVNGEDPEAVIQVARLAVDFRQMFGKDAIIDMYCYRKFGHNEGDEPRFTQPMMYKLIDKKPSVREVYVQKLIALKRVTREQADQVAAESKAALDQALEDARKEDWLKPPQAMGGVWAPYRGGPDASVPEVDTTVSRDKLAHLADRISALPDGFHPHPKVAKLLQERREKVKSGQTFDWGTAETLAYASLLMDGHRVRLSGQDVRRGTFSHRHAVLFDAESGERYMPLANLDADQAPIEVWDSPLSETGVLGFEYGYSLDFPEALVLWEAQFGDFANSAQVIIDQFIASAEDKWLRLSGITLLLPHGYEGQGPEHSSARIERFLQLSAEDNIQVCNVTTPAQFFHLLRRQVLRPWRKPLVIFTPKSLLRTRAASTIDELATGGFQRVIPDLSVEPNRVSRVLLCTGKVYYDLVEARKELEANDVAIVRLEQIHPLNQELPAALAAYADGTPLVWVQEEPKNSGPWYFLHANVRDLIGSRLPLSCVSRAASASPATGSMAAHKLEQKMLVETAFARHR